MKKSRFNIFVNYNDSILAFNSKTLALLELDKDFFDRFNCYNLTNEEKEILFKMGFLIEHDNELEYLEYIYNKKKFSKDSLNLTIKLTNNCNFRCKYCYQEHKKNTLSIQNADTIIKFIKKEIKKGYKSVNVHWFGGEPLLNLKPLFKIEKFLKDENIDGHSDITSNCYILDKSLIDKLKETRVSLFQITLDGNKLEHDFLRVTSSNKETFEKTIEKIKLLTENKMVVNLRININNRNKDFKDLLNYIKNLNIDNRFLNIYGNELTNFKLSEKIDNLYFKSLKEYSKRYFDFQKEFFNLKMNFPRPTNVNIGCEFETDSCFMIETDLNLFFCTSSDDNSLFSQGKILKNGDIKLNIDNYIKKLSLSPFKIEKCINCNILPMCMGGCTLKRMNDKESCIPEKYNLQNYIKLLYEEAVL